MRCGCDRGSEDSEGGGGSGGWYSRGAVWVVGVVRVVQERNCFGGGCSESGTGEELFW